MNNSYGVIELVVKLELSNQIRSNYNIGIIWSIQLELWLFRATSSNI